MNIKKIAACFTASAILFSAFGCSENDKYIKSSREERKTVIEIGEMDVPLEMYRYVALNYKNDYESGKSSDIWLGDTGAEMLKALERATDETLVSIYSVPLLALEYGIDPEKSYITGAVEQQMKEVYESFDKDFTAYAAELELAYMNDSVYRFIIRNDILSEEILYRMVENGEIVTDDTKMEEIISGNEFVRVKQILISDENGNTEEENRKKAEGILSELNAGADFDMLAQKYGEDLFMFNNPDGYYICRGTYDEEFEKTAFDLEIGEMSGIIRTDAGFSIVKKYPKEAAYLTKHFDELADLYRDSTYNIKLTEFAKSLTLKRLDECDKYTIFNLNEVK